MMRLSLRARLFLGHGLLLAAALATLTLLETQRQRSWLIAQDRAALERIARHLVDDLAARNAREPGTPGDWPEWAAQQGRGLGDRVTLIDSTGVVLGDSEVPREELPTLENHAGRPEVRAALSGRSGWAVRLSKSVGKELLYVALPARAPVARGGPAVVRVAEPLAVIARVNLSLLRLSLAAMGLTLLGMAVVLFWLTGRHTARIRELEQAAMQLGSAAAGVRAREQPEDSLGRLGRTINRMAEELTSRLHAIERERNERDLILAHMSDGVALLDREGMVLHMNHRLAAILGAARPADPGTSFTEFVRAPELDELLKRARTETRPVEVDLHLWAPYLRLVHATASPLGPGEGILLVLHDLTEVETLNRVRQDFVANVSHELRTPLTSMRGYAETLLEGGLDDLEQREGFVRVIRDQALRLEALISDLLSLADLERPEARLSWETFDVREAVLRQVAAFRPQAQSSRLGLELEPGPPQPVRADRARLDQVLANLIDNAVKYTERGRVSVRLGGDDAFAWCEVADTGPGIPPDDQPRIFERFYRVDKARARAKGGTGLGLSIVKHIVALHRGEVTVRSVPGEGSVFRFEIPRGVRLDPADPPG